MRANNIVQNTPKVETVGVNTQTQPMKYAEAWTNINLANNRFAQTHPMQYSEAGTNTNLPGNRFAQTQPMQYADAGTSTNLPSNRLAQTQPIHTQSTNTPCPNHISTHIDSCKCGEDEMDQTGIQYRSDFIRQLQQNETIPKYYTKQQVTNYNSHKEKPNISQTESSTIYHIPQDSISHTQPPAIQYTQQKTMHHIPQQSIYHTPIQSIQHTKITQQALQSPALQYRQTHGIENMEVDAIDYRAQKPLQYTQPQAITHAERPNMSQTESSTISNIPQANSHGPVRTEYFCMVCMTYFTTLRKLHKHMERFHDELRQEDRGIKRGGLKDSVEHIRKRNKAMNNEVEMSGDGFKNQDTESDKESNTFSEEDDDEYY